MAVSFVSGIWYFFYTIAMLKNNYRIPNKSAYVFIFTEILHYLHMLHYQIFEQVAILINTIEKTFSVAYGMYFTTLLASSSYTKRTRSKCFLYFVVFFSWNATGICWNTVRYNPRLVVKIRFLKFILRIIVISGPIFMFINSISGLLSPIKWYKNKTGWTLHLGQHRRLAFSASRNFCSHPQAAILQKSHKEHW